MPYFGTSEGRIDNSIVGVRARLCTGRSGGRVPVGYSIFLICTTARLALGPPGLAFNACCGSFLVAKRPEREVDHSGPPVAEVK